MIEEENFKGWFHAGVAMTVGVMLGYNVMRWCATRQTRNAVNIALYAPLVLWELRQARDHWSRTP